MFRTFSLLHRAPLAGRSLAAAKKRAAKVAKGIASVEPPTPGTVKPYVGHIFLEYDFGPAAPEKLGTDVWTADLEKKGQPLEPFVAALKARKSDTGGLVKVTACSKVPVGPAAASSASARPGPGRCRAIMVRPGSWIPAAFEDLPWDADSVVSRYFESGAGQPLKDLHLFICTHGSRDMRCTAIGEPLIARLAKAAAANEPGSSSVAGLYRVSHVGGHAWAGNVLVFGRGLREWFGGVNEGNAAQLLAELGRVEGPEDILKSALLRSLWRGRMGMEEEEQTRVHREAQACGACGARARGEKDCVGA